MAILPVRPVDDLRPAAPAIARRSTFNDVLDYMGSLVRFVRAGSGPPDAYLVRTFPIRLTYRWFLVD